MNAHRHMRGTYREPEERLRGRAALLRSVPGRMPTVLVQFDLSPGVTTEDVDFDGSKYARDCFGWHARPRRHFTIDPD